MVASDQHPDSVKTFPHADTAHTKTRLGLPARRIFKFVDTTCGLLTAEWQRRFVIPVYMCLA